MVYLPSGLDDETLRNVLAHEKAHIRRKDHLRKQFGFILLAIHWFNPLVWISYILFCKDIELSCDEMVISRMSLDEKKSYATSLLLCSTHQKLILAYPLAFGEVGVKTRIKQIFNYKKPSFWLIMMLVVISTMLSACFMTNSSDNGADGEGDSTAVSGVDVADGEGDSTVMSDTDGEGDSSIMSDTDGEGDSTVMSDTDGEGNSTVMSDTDGEGDSSVVSAVDEATDTEEIIIVDGKDNNPEELLTTENEGEKLASTGGGEVIEDSSEYGKYVTTP